MAYAGERKRVSQCSLWSFSVGVHFLFVKLLVAMSAQLVHRVVTLSYIRKALQWYGWQAVRRSIAASTHTPHCTLTSDTIT